jgi:hypothetical protein
MRTASSSPNAIALAIAGLTGACSQGNVTQYAPPTRAATTEPAPAPTMSSPPVTDPVPIVPSSPAMAPTATAQDELPPLFANDVQTASAAPIAGGTLLVTADGTTAVAADPDRNQVFLVDLSTHAVRSVAAQAGDELGRVLEGPTGTVFVAARRGGAVLAIDLAAGSVRSRFAVCNAPRGLAFDAVQNHLSVACRSGKLVTLDATTGAVVSTFDLEPDLRDVLLVNGSLVVTRFRSAEILTLDATGTVLARSAPPDVGPSTASVAFRTLGLPNGMLLMAHEAESSNELSTGFGAYYGGGCAGGGVVEQLLSLVSLGAALPALPANSPSTGVDSAPTAPFSIHSDIIDGALGPLDIAVSRDGKRVAVVASGNAWDIKGELPTLYVDALDVTSGTTPPSFATGDCGASDHLLHMQGEPTAVAFDAAGNYVVQSREPATLELEGEVIVPLSTESHFDTGFAMFHMNASGGISCASCHPEGGEDGHVWAFQESGLRRSQALEADVSSRAPFHWSGDLPTFEDLFSEVMLKRMALPVIPPPEDTTALETWLDTVPALAPADGLDQTLVAQGQTVFNDPTVGCTRCHFGAQYTDHLKHDVGTGGAFVTPALLGVGVRAPLMHDGCAASLADRFGPCGGTAHGDVSSLAQADIDALVAFMRSL